MDHALAIGEVAVRLAESEQAGEISDLKIQTEPAVWRHYVASSGRVLVLKPDLGVHLTSGGQRLVWFVEVDRATERLKRIRTKASQYLDYWRSGREQDRLGSFPPRGPLVSAWRQAGLGPCPHAGAATGTGDGDVRCRHGRAHGVRAGRRHA